MELRLDEFLKVFESTRIFLSKSPKIPSALQYKLSRILFKGQEEAKIFESSKVEIFKQYGDAVEDGYTLDQSSEENKKAAINALNQILQNEINVSWLKKLKFSEVVMHLDSETLLSLSSIIEDDESEVSDEMLEKLHQDNKST